MQQSSKGKVEDQYTTLITLEQLPDGSNVYFAYHPELPGCMTDGETIEEARINLSAATEMCLAHLRESNLPIPQPHFLFGDFPKSPQVLPKLSEDVRCAPVNSIELALSV